MSDRGILIIGCGFTGAALAQRLAFKGEAVYGTTRTETQADVIRTRGAQAVMLDVSDLKPLKRLKGRVRAVVSLVPPKMDDSGGYTDAHGALVKELQGWKLDKLVYVSSTSVYGDRQGGRVDEHTPCTPDSPRGKARLEIETALLASDCPAIVVRPSGIYGRGRSQFERLIGGRVRLVAGGESLTNRIHVRDLAMIIDAAIERGQPGATYLASDEAPSRQVDVFNHLVETYEMPEPNHISLDEARIRMNRNVLAMVTGSKYIDASWTREQLGVTLRFPDYRRGLAEIWRHDSPALTESARAVHLTRSSS